MNLPFEVRRSPQQLARDKQRRAEQVQEITGTTDAQYHSLTGRLLERSAASAPKNTRRRYKEKPDGRVVAEGEIMVARNGKGRGRPASRLGSLGFEEVDLTKDHSELAEHLAVFRMPSSNGHRGVNFALTRLRDAGFSADEVAVSALYRPVMKALHGPSPTTVSGNVPPAPPRTCPQVAIIDTGISREDHRSEWLKHVRPVRGASGNIDEKDVQPNNGLLDFGAGHGTFAAGIVRQVAPSARISVYRALDTSGYGTEIAVANALIRAVSDGAQVVSLSLGCQQRRIPTAFKAALAWIAANKKGSAKPVIVAAAGNFGNDAKVWPAAHPSVVAVAGLTAGLHGARWSSRGSWVNCSAVGEGVVSTFVEGTEDPDLVLDDERFRADTYGPDPWAVWTGTSFAAPQVAGAIAQRMHDESETAQAAKRAVLATGTALPKYGKALRFLSGT